jgi:hypothetical protein
MGDQTMTTMDEDHHTVKTVPKEPSGGPDPTVPDCPLSSTSQPTSRTASPELDRRRCSEPPQQQGLDRRQSGPPVRQRELVLDVSAVSYLDRKGAGLVLWLEAEARKRGWWVGVVATPAQTGLLAGLESQLFPSYSDAIWLARLQSHCHPEDTDSLNTKL